MLCPNINENFLDIPLVFHYIHTIGLLYYPQTIKLLIISIFHTKGSKKPEWTHPAFAFGEEQP